MEPLEKYRVPEDRDWPVDRVGKLLNLAIDRINELESKLHAEQMLTDRLIMRHEGHTHEYGGHGHGLDRSINYYNDKVTTPPTDNGTRGERKA